MFSRSLTMLENNHDLPKGFRALGFMFFMCGGFFHCIDFLGVEKTLEWGTGMGFLLTLALTIYFWGSYIARNKSWRSIF
ncbi:hypothetical protein KR100_06400 [Synechococcus sp. KORDI-100]|nr:hypothetical protein KR100_06400 [Synechococcus sp. KORDI-100]